MAETNAVLSFSRCDSLIFQEPSGPLSQKHLVDTYIQFGEIFVPEFLVFPCDMNNVPNPHRNTVKTT